MQVHSLSYLKLSNRQVSTGKMNDQSQDSEKAVPCEPTNEDDDDDVEFFTESNKFKQMMFENLHGIAAKFNLKYPINPKLTYDYPPINPIICQNIANSLYKYPKFYTQTLHLMNKMNLPCPLVDYVREPFLCYFPAPTEVNIERHQSLS